MPSPLESEQLKRAERSQFSVMVFLFHLTEKIEQTRLGTSPDKVTKEETIRKSLSLVLSWSACLTTQSTRPGPDLVPCSLVPSMSVVHCLLDDPWVLGNVESVIWGYILL